MPSCYTGGQGLSQGPVSEGQRLWAPFSSLMSHSKATGITVAHVTRGKGPGLAAGGCCGE